MPWDLAACICSSPNVNTKKKGAPKADEWDDARDEAVRKGATHSSSQILDQQSP